MPSARSATSAAARSGSTARQRSAARSTARARAAERPAARRPRPRHVPLRSAATRVRWERLGRVALLVVLLAVVVVYGEHAVSYLSTREQNGRQQAIVRSLERRHAQLEARERALSNPTTIVRRARQLGMTRTGEQPYAITGKSSH